jgi:hypothetical protein
MILINTACNDIPDEPLILEFPIDEKEELMIISPSTGDSFEPGGLLKIRWLSSPSLNEVDIYLLKNNQIVHTFALKQKNNGTYGWFIDDDIEKSGGYSIKVVNSFEEMEFDISDYFNIREKETKGRKPRP